MQPFCFYVKTTPLQLIYSCLLSLHFKISWDLSGPKDNFCLSLDAIWVLNQVRLPCFVHFDGMLSGYSIPLHQLHTHVYSGSSESHAVGCCCKITDKRLL